MIDPKPELSRAAILSNIEYYSEQESKYQYLLDDAKSNIAKWTEQLNKLDKIVVIDGIVKLRPRVTP